MTNEQQQLKAEILDMFIELVNRDYQFEINKDFDENCWTLYFRNELNDNHFHCGQIGSSKQEELIKDLYDNLAYLCKKN